MQELEEHATQNESYHDDVVGIEIADVEQFEKNLDVANIGLN